MQNPTKLLLSGTLKRMCVSMQLKNISVQKLVSECSLNRGTFYYHFKDIQDLINWIYHTEITVPTHEYIKYNTDSEPQISKLVLNKLFADKAFYTQALAMRSQNNLYEYMLEETKSNWMCLSGRILRDLHLAEQTVTAQMHMALESAMTYYCYGHFFATQQWVKNGMSISPDVFAHMLDTAATKGLYSMLIEAIR